MLDRDGKNGLAHAVFRDLPRFLRPRSVIALNDTQVIPARVVGRKSSGGAVELLLVRPVEETDGAAAVRPGWREAWEVLGKGLRGVGAGGVIAFDDANRAVVVELGERGAAIVRFEGREPGGLPALLDRLGRIPLPPYIEAARRRESDAAPVDDRVRYQTVYAAHPGAVAAPTAGLHFTPELLAALSEAGHEVVRLTLHVGPGTFRPVEVDDPSQHRMDPERFIIPTDTTAAVLRARAEGRPIVAIGTTVVRALEAAARAGLPREPRTLAGDADLFLKPGDRFEVVTDLVTNFHLPRSTLLMLVAAFAGRDNVLAAYHTAVDEGYRFYSYGDAMFISPGALARSS